MRQFLISSVAAVFFGAVTSFSEYTKLPETGNEVEVIPQSPTTEQLLQSTELYGKVLNIEDSVNRLHEEIRNLE